MSVLKHEKRERKTVSDEWDHYSGTIEGYDIHLDEDRHGNGVVLDIYPADQVDRVRLGIIKCRPKNVAALEQFADDAPRLFRALAAELRALGKDDFRDEYEKTLDDRRTQRCEGLRR